MEQEIPFGAFDSELMHQEISIPKGFTATIEGDKIVLTRTESEDERTRKHLISLVKNWDKDGIASKYTSDPNDIKQILAWLEKQGKPIDEEKVLIGARKDIALSIMDFLDKNTLGMYLSNMECEDLEDAVVNSDWSKVYNYMKKKLEKQGEQKPVDKVEPKFHWGDCVVDNCGYVWKVEGILNQFYILEGIEGGESRPTTEWVDKTFHLWTIKDAKNGDVLASELCDSIILFRGIKDNNIDFYCDYDFSKIDVSGDRFAINNGQHYGNVEDSKDFHPATKEQRDTLFAKMKEAGYAFDFENKELKKIERKPATWSEEDEGFLKLLLAIFTNEHPNGIFSTDNIPVFKGNCVASNRIIAWLNTLKGRVGCEENCTTTKEWSEEDEWKINRIYSILRQAADTHAFSTSCRLIGDKECIELQDFLKSLKPQPKQEWSEEDDQYLLVCKNALAKYQASNKWDARIISCWLENKLKAPQNTWKPSDEQMKALDIAIRCGIQLGTWEEDALKSLKEQLFKLKKLRKE